MASSIEGLCIRVSIGGLEFQRTPRIVLTYRRRTVLSTCEIDIPDPEGELLEQVGKDQPVNVQFWYRGGDGLRQHWQGTVEGKTVMNDTIRVRCVGLEKKLLTTTVTEAMHGEPARVVAARLLAATGLPVAKVNVPGDVLPHIVFSGVTVARAIRQLADSLERSFGHNLAKHAVWLGESGLYWSDGDEPLREGGTPLIASCETLLTHSPNADPAGLSEVVSILYPGIRDSQQIRIKDARRGTDASARAEEVIHQIEEARGNTTTIRYGANYGWG